MGLFISCLEATKQLIRKEETPLNSGEARKLALHLFLCKYCKNFANQMVFMHEALKTDGPQLKLDPEFKQMLEKLR
jgi:hypothetical protein